MGNFRAVFDTNVLYAGIYSSTGASHQLLRLIERGLVTPILSTALVFEYEEVLKRNQKLLKLSDRAVDDVLNGMCRQGVPQKIHFLWRPQLSDPKDDHVLELAVAAGSADIITHNEKDFVQASTFGIRIVTPRVLLGELK